MARSVLRDIREGVRAAIQASAEPVSVLAERFGTTEQTVYKWRHRDTVHDRSHTPHRLQTTLTPAQKAVAVALRKTLLVLLDDLLAVVREFLNPEVSRSGLDRCLRRHGGKRDADPLLPFLICPSHTSRRCAAAVLDLERDGEMGVYLDGPRDVGVSRLEVLDGPSGRRQRTKAERARIAAESMMPCV